MCATDPSTSQVLSIGKQQMMKLDNSKRMAALKGMLKDEKKKKQEKQEEKERKKSAKSTGSVSTRSSGGSNSKSNPSKSTKSKSSLSRASSRKALTNKRWGIDNDGGCEPPLVESSMEFVSPKNAIKLQQSWELIQHTVPSVEIRVGEEVFVSMLEIDPSVRQSMGVTSLRSPEFEALCKRIAGHIQTLVNAAGPSSSLEFSSLDLGEELEQDNISPSLLADSVPLAMKKIIGQDQYTDEVADAWGYFFAKHVARMTRDD